MTSILIAIAAMAGLGMVMSIVLGLAAKVFYVYVDPRIESILDILPGANCGGCGYAGCNDYAEAIVVHGAAPNLCVAASEETTEGVCTLMGMSTQRGERKVARIFCQGDDERAVKRFEYSGAGDCRAAIISTGGDRACGYGCVGLGTCVRSCPFNALDMGQNGLPQVKDMLCTGCGHCVQVCPRNIPQLIPASQKTANLCSSHDAEKTVKQVCSTGCIACGICIQKCGQKAVSMVDKLAVVDAQICTGQMVCVDKCPTGSMVSLVPEQALPETERQAETAQAEG